ncbi:serine/threonine-protein kinase [Nocardia sp. NPDC051832]|uniref:serine/threonine-protein kinase n=1 Tax=Nocardia sp. NPDC051832 TaxID=3155673 RepID=UPI00343A195D
MRELRPGSEVAGYRIGRRLGAGGMGAVYLAQHPRLPRHDALKVLARARSADPRFRERFRREAKLASRLDHPNLVAIYGSGEDGELLWIAMQFVDGQDASELVRAGGLPAERAITIATGAARGLDAAHAAGLLHRDVKPANILVAHAGEHVLVTDFGIAKEEVGGTATGMMPATLAYAAPEQIRGGTVDRRADVYGLGATLYHLLTGQVPFRRETTAAMLHAQLSAPPPRPSRAVPTLPVALDAVIARAMAKDPAERYASCGELAEAAGAALGGRSFRRIRRVRTAVAAAVGAATVVATVAAFGLPGDAGPPSPPATAAQPPVSPWGSADFIVSAFPAMLPPAPTARNYLDLTCKTVDDAAVPAVVCTGENPDVWWLMVKCRTDRAAYPPIATDGETRTWTRPSGSGSAVLRTDPDQYRGLVGKLDIRFDSPDRNFCALQAFGMTGGAELFDQWWPATPI